jgi:hypothetical protein
MAMNNEFYSVFVIASFPEIEINRMIKAVVDRVE